MKKKSLTFYFLTTLVITLLLLIIQSAFTLNKTVFYAITGVSLLACVVLAIRRPKDFFDFLASIKLAAVLLFFVTAGVAVGTLILQNVDEARYLASYSEGFVSFVKTLKLNDTYHSIWFISLVAILNLNLLLCTIEKLPIRKRNFGFFLIHLSILVVVFGGSLSNIFGVKGYIHFYTGKSFSDYHLTSFNKMLKQKESLGFSVRLDKFDIEFYPEDFRVYVYTRKTTKENFGMPYSFKAKEGESYKVKAMKGEVKIEKFYPNYKTEQKLVEKEGGKPAVSVKMQLPDGEENGVFFDSEGLDRFFLPATEGLVIFKWDKPQDPLYEAREKFLLDISFPNKEGKTIELTQGKEVAFDENTTIQLDTFLPSFSMEQAKGTEPVKKGNPDNPAVKIVFKNKADGNTTDHWVFANFPEFSHGKGFPGDADLTFRYVPTLNTKPVYIVSSDKSVVEIFNGKIVKEFLLEDNVLSFDTYKVIFDKFIANAEVVQEDGNATGGFKNPVVKVTWIQNGKEESLMFSSKDKNAAFNSKGTVAFMLRNKEMDPKAYRSHLTVIDNGEEVVSKVVEVNNPLMYKGFYFYQSNYDPKNPEYSGISVVKDPGVYIVFTGFLMLVIGGILRFYFKM